MITFKQFIVENVKQQLIDAYYALEMDKEKIPLLSRQAKQTVTELGKGLDFETIGDGAFAVALHRKDLPYIVKIFSNKDIGYKLWLEFCKKNKSNPYVPQIIGSDVAIGKTWFRAVRIEKLSKVKKVTEFRRHMDQVRSGETKDTHLSAIFNYIDHHSQGSLVGDKSKIIHSRPIRIDLHSGNIMMRGNQYVIIDPLATI